MPPRLAACWALTAFAASIVALPGPAAADYALSVSGTYQSSSNSTFRTDGTNVVTDDLPPILDLGRLRGGSFEATFVFPQVTPRTSGTFASYPFGPRYGMTFRLFDAAGAVVHEGTSPSSPAALIFHNAGTPPRVFDQASFVAFVNTVTNLHFPSVVVGPSQIADVFQSGLIFGGDVTATTHYLNDLSIPVDAATYLRFPRRTFSTGVEWTDGDSSGSGPSQYIETHVSYDITSVRVAAVPEPGSALLLAAGAATFGVARRARSRPRRGARPVDGRSP